MSEKSKKILVHIGRMIHITRVIIDLKMIRGCFKTVNKNVAPNKDKGIYFEKAMHDLDKTIKKYEKMLEVKK